MNKKLLTLAVAGAIVGGMGVAQADVTVYGKAHVSLDSMHVDLGGGAAYANDGNLVVANNSSRLGFKFSEDLGGSFFKKAVGQYEATVSLDGEDTANTTTCTATGTGVCPPDVTYSTSTKGLFGGSVRNSFLGVETAGGTVLAGIYDTPFKIVGRAVELFPEQLGDARNLTSPGGATWDLRPNNVVAYMSPSLAGVSVAVAWSADTATNANTDNNSNAVASASVAYKGGPLYVAGAYEVHDSNILTTGTIGPENETGYRIVASGTFGIFKVIGLYQGLSDVSGIAGADRDVWGLGAAVTLAEKHVIKAQYYSAGDIDPVSDSGADMYAVGYDFKVSKKTTAYVNYAMTSNGAFGSYGVNGGGHGDTLSTTNNAFRNADVSGVSAGMIMDF